MSSSDLDIAMGVVWGVVGAAIVGGLCAFTYFYFRERPEQIPRPPKLPPPQEQQRRINEYISRKFPRRPKPDPAAAAADADPEADPEAAAAAAAAGDPLAEAEAAEDGAEVPAGAAPPPPGTAAAPPVAGAGAPELGDAAGPASAPAKKRFSWLAALKSLGRRPDASTEVAGDDPETPPPPPPVPAVQVNPPERSTSNLSNEIRPPEKEVPAPSEPAAPPPVPQKADTRPPPISDTPPTLPEPDSLAIGDWSARTPTPTAMARGPPAPDHDSAKSRRTPSPVIQLPYLSSNQPADMELAPIARPNSHV